MRLFRRKGITTHTLLNFGLSFIVLGIFLCPVACGVMWGVTGYLAGAVACQNTPVTGSCGTPPFARVQVVPTGCAQGTSCHIIGGSNTQSRAITETAGNLLVAFAYSGQNVGGSNGGTAPNMIFTVTDTLGNTFYPGPYINNATYNDAAIQIFYAANIIGGANTVTVSSTAGAGAQQTGLVLIEYSGIATVNPVDLSSGQPAPGSTTIVTPGTITAQTACDLVVGGMDDGHVINEHDTAGAGWVEPVLDFWDPAAFVDNVAVGTSYGATASATIDRAGAADNGWASVQMAFRAANTQALCQPTQIGFVTAAQTVTHGTCSGAVTIESQNSSGQATADSSGINVSLTGTGLTFYADSSCTWPVTSVLLGAGSSSITFYYKAAATGSPVMIGTATGFTSFYQTETSD